MNIRDIEALVASVESLSRELEESLNQPSTTPEGLGRLLELLK